MSTGAEQWVEHEFAAVALGDARLDRRFRSLLVDLSRHCGKTLASSFEPWSKIKGACRFFANARVHLYAMLAPHSEQTLRRIRDHDAPIVLVVQDATYLDFGARASTGGLDQVGRHPAGSIIEGLMLHDTLACDVEGLPLGLLDQRFIARPALGASDGREGGRWADVIGAVHERRFGDARAVHLMDREGDDYALFARAAALGEHVLVSASQAGPSTSSSRCSSVETGRRQRRCLNRRPALCSDVDLKRFSILGASVRSVVGSVIFRNIREVLEGV